jgi:hypothetical protein
MTAQTIAFARAQQLECRAKIAANGWDEFTALGLSDWLHEEILLEMEAAKGGLQ